jgi:hypothetical protein
MLTSATGGRVSVFDSAPNSLNPPALVVGRATGNYDQFALGVDELELPIVVVGTVDDDDGTDALAEKVRLAVLADPTIAGTVHAAAPARRANPRNASITGIEVQTTEVVLSIRM